MTIYRNLPIFCCWRRKTIKGRKTKVTYTPANRIKASGNQPQPFSDYLTAIANANNYDGIGIRVAYQIIVIDLDHCVEDGILQPWAKEVTEHFPQAYIKYSPNGTRLHIFCKFSGTYNTDLHYIHKGAVEIYADEVTNRYLTITGDVYQNGDIVIQAKCVEWLKEKYMKRRQPLNSTTVISECDSYHVNILKDAQVYHPIAYGDFDKDPYIFNCSNGTLHLYSQKFTEHRNIDLLTKISPVLYLF